MRLFKLNSPIFYTCVALFLTTHVTQSLAQSGVITGKIRDADTAEPLAFTHVFINQTTIGTVTDEQGNYTLNNVPVGSNEIVFSFVGYHPYQTRIQIKNGESKQLDIRLQPDDTQLETVEVKGTRDKEWDKQLKKFEKIFLGTTKFAGATKILNAWVLDFKELEVNGKNAFTATASKPLEIENRALGYRVVYYLKSMISNSEGHNITGEVRFEELTSSDLKTVKMWNQNRVDAYNGSLRHLIKSIIEGTVAEEGFNLYTDKKGYENNMHRTSVFSSQLDKTIQVFSTKNSVLPGKTEDEFIIQLPQRLEVHFSHARARLKVYSDIPCPVSWVQANSGILRTHANGVLLNSSSATVSGAMYENRVADLLPYNYSPDQTTAAQAKIAESPVVKKLKRLEEKVYVQTDKPYYYPGERIWFKAYMNYKTPELMDSLSRVLYVELVSQDRKIEQTKVVFIEDGSGDGSFVLPEKIEAGNYMVRAYTQWMLNYDHDSFFVKSLPVLDLYERPGVDSVSEVTELSKTKIKLTSDKTLFHPHEKIDLEFSLRDQEDNPIYADLSVSVTDMQQVVNVPDRKNSLNSFLFTEDESEKRFANEIKYPVESGICISGQYKNKKGLPAKTSFMVLVEKSNKMLPVETDVKGNFVVSNLQFYDSTELVFQNPGKKKKFEGSVTLHKREVPSADKLTADKSLHVVKTETEQRKKLPDTFFEEMTLIKNVAELEDTNEIDQLNKDNIPRVYSKADFSISGEEIVRLSRTSLVNALKGRVPGFNVVNGLIRFGGQSNFMGAATTEPLLILDGLQITSGAGERLNQINPEIVERVDIIKYGGAAIYGTRGSNGVIIVTTKSGEGGITNTSIIDLGLILNVKGYSKPLMFVAPSYSNVIDHTIQPDYRSTLYWAPQVVTDKIGNAAIAFFAADTATRYRVVVEGVTATGEPVRGEFFIDVVK